MKIAWIGTGIMGYAMVKNLAIKYKDINVFNRTHSKAESLQQYGINVCNNIKQCVKDADIVFTMVGFPSEVEDIYFKEDGILKNIKKDAICIDMTTSSPTLAKKIYQYHNKCLDAPVSGGDIGAKNATLSIMVGGDESSYKKVYPLFKLLGTKINYFGNSGNGQLAKLSNQIAVAGNIGTCVEMLYFAHINNLDTNLIIETIGSGAGSSWQILNNGKKMINKDFNPGFYIKHFIKDMELIKQENKGKNLIILENVYKWYKKLEQENMQDLGTQALIYYYLNS